ncbi:MAG: hypothetical protein QOG23_3850 [Blastocatellia bacterium]|jgi:hypothetical protein|nr:hypothetical protein [Blastocatellia bacterium]
MRDEVSTESCRERGHPVRLSAPARTLSEKKFIGGKLERAAPAGGHDVRAPYRSRVLTLTIVIAQSSEGTNHRNG